MLNAISWFCKQEWCALFCFPILASACGLACPPPLCALVFIFVWLVVWVCQSSHATCSSPLSLLRLAQTSCCKNNEGCKVWLGWVLHERRRDDLRTSSFRSIASKSGFILKNNSSRDSGSAGQASSQVPSELKLPGLIPYLQLTARYELRSQVSRYTVGGAQGTCLPARPETEKHVKLAKVLIAVF